MSLLGIDTSQLIGRYEDNQGEWADVEQALRKAFPDQSMAELHAAATAYVSCNPGATMDELLTALQAQFAVTISAELAVEIRQEWDEFSRASALNPAQLLAVLDDYDADSVDTGSRAYLMFLMQHLIKEIARLSTETDLKALESDMERYQAEMDKLYAATTKATTGTDGTEDAGTDATRTPAERWLFAAAAVINTAIVLTLTAAMALLIGPGALLIMGISLTVGTLAVVDAATDGGVTKALADLFQALGMTEGKAERTAENFAILSAVLSGVLGIAAYFGAGPLIQALTGATTQVVQEQTTPGGGRTLPDDPLSKSEGEFYQALVAELVALLRLAQGLDLATLDAIFAAMRDVVTETGSSGAGIVQQEFLPNMA
ncbi:hypothetical protein [Desulfocurvus vexinensis]|uniref:hypothetical protein n=1 Tax=Desulfocurvus vexinensis TaxID=399548 RepID=UPI00048D817E|nr:hypothetical protein [Desulfocurvus vexinensis]